MSWYTKDDILHVHKHINNIVFKKLSTLLRGRATLDKAQLCVSSPKAPQTSTATIYSTSFSVLPPFAFTPDDGIFLM